MYYSIDDREKGIIKIYFIFLWKKGQFVSTHFSDSNQNVAEALLLQQAPVTFWLGQPVSYMKLISVFINDNN